MIIISQKTWLSSFKKYTFLTGVFLLSNLNISPGERAAHHLSLKFSDLQNIDHIANAKNRDSDHKNVQIFLERKGEIALSWMDCSSFSKLENSSISRKGPMEIVKISEKKSLAEEQKAWIYLNFDQLHAERLKDISNHFQVIYSSYIPIKHGNLLKKTQSPMLPGRFAIFNNPENKIELIPQAYINAVQDSQNDFFERSFAIHFYAYPKNNQMEMNLLDFGTFQNLSHRGFQIKLFNRSLILNLENILANENGHLLSKKIYSRLKLSPEKWNRVMILYIKHLNQIKLYINNQLDSITNFNNNLISLGNSSRLITLAKNYQGYLDEFFWLRAETESILQTLKNQNVALNNDTIYNPVIYDETKDSFIYPYGKFSSPIIDLEEYGVRLKNFRFSGNLSRHKIITQNDIGSESYLPFRATQGTTVRIQIRLNNKLTEADPRQSQGTWQDLNLDTGRVRQSPEGRFFQWRILLYGDYQGTHTPEINKISFHLTGKKPLFIPRNLQVDAISSGKIRLSWGKSSLKSFIGYRINYGINPEEVLGFIDFIDGKRITSQEFAQGKKIVVEIDNKTIEQNKYYHANQEFSNISFPPLEEHILYFFQVLAYDDYGFAQKNPENFFSAPSKMVFARPYANK
jgi:hypothetical protein